MSIRNNRGRTLAMAGLAAGVLAASNVVCAQIPCGGYEVTAIIQQSECPPFGFPPTIGTAISEPIHGGLPNVVGYYHACLIGPPTAFLWIGNEDRLLTLDMPDGTFHSRARDIGADGTQIVGTADIAGVGSRAFFSDGNDLIVIPPANGGTFTDGQAVSLGRVAGTTSISNRPPYYTRAFLWQEGRMTIIEPTNGPNSAGRDVSESGAVVGWMGNGIASDSHPFIWDGRTVFDIGLPPNSFASWAKAINDIGVVLVRGEFDANEPTDRKNGSFLLRHGKFIDLGQLPGYDVIAGIDMNDQSQIVGLARAVDSSDQPDVGFIWQDGVMHNLNDLIDPDAGLTIKRAEAINQAGQITGRGSGPNGEASFLLTPLVPPLGDINGDCTIGVVDLLMLLGTWGACDDCENCSPDLNGDCVVGVADLLILLANWG